MLRIENVKNGNVVTIHIRGFGERSNEIMEKYIRRGVKTAIDTLKEGAVYGGGIAKVAVAEKIRKEALHGDGKYVLAMEEFAKALEDVAKVISRNMGMDGEIAVSEMRKKVRSGEIDERLLRSYPLEKSEIERAAETAIMMLRISDVLSAKPLVKRQISGGRGGVIIYTSTGCPYCRKAKAYLRSKGVAFKEINVSQNPAALQEMIRKSGQTGTPVIDINGRIIVGFDVARIDAALKK